MVLAAILYVLDHIFFSLALATKTYFQKILDLEDIAPMVAVAFTINHILAVFLPILLGYIWLHSPAYIFLPLQGSLQCLLVWHYLFPPIRRRGVKLCTAA